MHYLNPDIDVNVPFDTLWEINSVFTQETLDWLDTFFEHGYHWHMDRRLARMSYPVGNDEDPFRELGLEMAELCRQTTGLDVEYRKAKLFLDLPGSEVPRHRDATDISIMSQVYLMKSNHPIPGTTFMEPITHTVKYEQNCGYFNLNADLKTHQSGFLTNGYRTSIGFQFV